MTTSEPCRVNHNPTFTEIISGIASGARELAAAHAAQLQSEVRHGAAQAQSAGLFMAAGLLLAGLGAVFLLVAVVMVLIEVLLWPAWVSWLVVGVAGAAIGAALLLAGRQQWSEVHLIPEHTLHSVRESLSCLTNGKK
jgi:hypothetical protein